MRIFINDLSHSCLSGKRAKRQRGVWNCAAYYDISIVVVAIENYEDLQDKCA